MNVSVEKREVVGVLQLNFAYFNLLDVNPKSALLGSTRFHVIDWEGFDNYIFVKGEYVIIPSIVPTFKEVKFLSEKQPELTKESID